MAEQTEIICCRCRQPLQMAKASFSYIGEHFSHEVLRCASCGMIYIPEDLAKGKIAEVEKEMEDK